MSEELEEETVAETEAETSSAGIGGGIATETPVEALDFGLSLFEDPTSIYTNNEVAGGSPDLNQVFWGMDNDGPGDDMLDLMDQGYTPL